MPIALRTVMCCDLPRVEYNPKKEKKATKEEVNNVIDYNKQLADKIKAELKVKELAELNKEIDKEINNSI